MGYRIEKDFLGEKKIPQEVYYGVQTARALENFAVSGIRMDSQPVFIQAYAFVKKAAAMANRDCGVLKPEIADVISAACDRIIKGEFSDQFVTDLLQGGAGTSVNMNFNEVIANIGLEMMGYPKSEYLFLHPNNHVNCSQSTNDTYPTALNLALYKKTERYIEVLENLRNVLLRKADQFKGVVKMGRTQLQDAVPMTLGQEFHGFASTVSCEIRSLTHAQSLLTCCNMGGTAIGTSINTPPGYPEMVTDYLAGLTGVPLKLNPDLIQASSDAGNLVALSSAIKRSAVSVSKICNDLRLLASGPRSGFHEINLPQLQPGSSIMPGKVNPVMLELVNEAAFYAIGADLTVTMAAEAGQLQLNVMSPVITFSLFTSLDYLTNSIRLMYDKCLKGITANEEVCKADVMGSVGIITLLNPVLGYETTSLLAREALLTGKNIFDLVVKERRLLSEEYWNYLYQTGNLIEPLHEEPRLTITG